MSAQAQAGTAFPPLGKVGRSWGWLLAFGILTLLAGLAVLIWPGASILVIAVIFGVQLLAGGIFWFFNALASEDRSVGAQILLAVLAILAGVVVLRYPVQSAFIFPLVLGLFWTINGVVETFHAVVRHAVPMRGWAISAGVLSLIAGIVLLVYPGIGLVTLTWLLGFWLVVYGGITTSRAIRMRPHGALAASTPPQAGPAPA